MLWPLLLVTMILARPLVAQAPWLPYARLLESHGAQSVWQLGALRGLVTTSTAGAVALAWNASIERNTLMVYECEIKDALVLGGVKSRVEDVLPAGYELPWHRGFTIELFLWRAFGGPVGSTVVGAWGWNAKAWQLHFTDQDQLAFSWGNTNTTWDPEVTYTCYTLDPLIVERWTHVAVRYTPAGPAAFELFVDGASWPTGGACGAITGIRAPWPVAVDVGHHVMNGTSTANFLGKVAKLAFYHKAVPAVQLAEHAARARVTVGPCNGHGTCDAVTSLCRCQPDWFDTNCTRQFNLTSISPTGGSMYGGTPVTLTGSGFLAVDGPRVHIRIGPTITAVDQFAGAEADWSGCNITNVSDTQIVCVTEPQKRRGAMNLSVVAYDPVGPPVRRPVFSACQFTTSVQECYFTPSLDRTPRIWAAPQWAVAGDRLRVLGAGFVYSGFRLAVGGAGECALDAERPANATEFSCLLPAGLAAGQYRLQLTMLPLGIATPFPSPLYIQPPALLVYPLYPVPGANPNCPRTGLPVQIHTSNYAAALNATEIRVYEAACYQRRTADFLWTLDKVPLDYWVTYGYDQCPPDLSSYADVGYVPSAFTLQDYSVEPRPRPRKQRRFIDSRGMQHCLAMEPLPP